ncbi:MAG: hypothetical protein ACOY46_05235 [Bacillota bacterium]
MLEFIIVVILANLVMMALLYFLRHAIAIRAPVLFIAVGISIIYCIIYPFLAAQMHYPKVLYLYVLLIMAGAGALYYIEVKFFSARELSEGNIASMTVGEALAAMEGAGDVQRANKLAVYWESIVSTIRGIPGIRKDSETASGVYVLSNSVAAAGVLTGPADPQTAKFQAESQDLAPDGRGCSIWEATQPEDLKGFVEPAAAEEVVQGDSECRQAHSGEKAEIIPEEVEEFMPLEDEVAILSVESEDTVPDEQGYVLEEAVQPENAEYVTEHIAAEEVGQGASEYQQDGYHCEAEAVEYKDTAQDERWCVLEEEAQPDDEEEAIDYIEAETGEPIEDIGLAEQFDQAIPEDLYVLTATLEVAEMIASAEFGTSLVSASVDGEVSIEEIPVAQSGVGGMETEYIQGIGDTYNESEAFPAEQDNESQMTAQEDEISIIVAKAFDLLAHGDSAGAVDMFFKALKMGPPPRLAVLLCTRISSIYMAQGLKRQALSIMEMLEVVWGPSLNESELKGIKSIIIQLRGEV